MRRVHKEGHLVKRIGLSIGSKSATRSRRRGSRRVWATRCGSGSSDAAVEAQRHGPPSRERWYDYSRARDKMLEATDTEHARWYLLRSDDKRRARLNLISHGVTQLRDLLRIALWTACMMLLAAMPTLAQDCRAIRRACVSHCISGTGSTGDLNPVTAVLPSRVKACITRCSIAPCEETPLAARLCDATAQRICDNGFRGCSGACIPSTATTAAEIGSQACSTSTSPRSRPASSCD
jgi:hypothetical protein